MFPVPASSVDPLDDVFEVVDKIVGLVATGSHIFLSPLPVASGIPTKSSLFSSSASRGAAVTYIKHHSKLVSSVAAAPYRATGVCVGDFLRLHGPVPRVMVSPGLRLDLQTRCPCGTAVGLSSECEDTFRGYSGMLGQVVGVSEDGCRLMVGVLAPVLVHQEYVTLVIPIEIEVAGWTESGKGCVKGRQLSSVLFDRSEFVVGEDTPWPSSVSVMGPMLFHSMNQAKYSRLDSECTFLLGRTAGAMCGAAEGRFLEGGDALSMSAATARVVLQQPWEEHSSRLSYDAALGAAASQTLRSVWQDAGPSDLHRLLSYVTRGHGRRGRGWRVPSKSHRTVYHGFRAAMLSSLHGIVSSGMPAHALERDARHNGCKLLQHVQPCILFSVLKWALRSDLPFRAGERVPSSSCASVRAAVGEGRTSYYTRVNYAVPVAAVCGVIFPNAFVCEEPAACAGGVKRCVCCPQDVHSDVHSAGLPAKRSRSV